MGGENEYVNQGLFGDEQFDEQFDELAELAELACRIEDGDVPICEYLRCTAWFEFFVAYGRANRERKKED